MQPSKDRDSIVSTVVEEKYKIIIVGESGVGKSSIFKCFIEELGESNSQINYGNQVMTTTIDFRIKNMMVDDSLIKYYVWDTAGQEKYRSMVSAYFKGCQAVFIIFDVTNKESLDKAIDVWAKLAAEKTTNALIFLVGNKIDLEQQRTLDKESNQKIADDNKLRYFETSAMENLGIFETFLAAGQSIRQMLSIGKKQIQQKKTKTIQRVITEEDYTAQVEEIQNKKNSFSLEKGAKPLYKKQKEAGGCGC